MDDRGFHKLKALIEALLFVAPAPLSIRRICEVTDVQEKETVKIALNMLSREMARADRGLELVQVAGGWRIQTKRDFANKIRALRQGPPQRLSRAGLETLAIIAYRQPVTRAEIEQARGVDSSGTIRHLLDKRLIRIAGRKDVPGRPLLYGTTRRFLEVFQLNDLNTLPSCSELKPAGENRQRFLFEQSEKEQ